MFIVTFSDGHTLPVKASCRASARAVAYRAERSLSIVSVDPA
ncbi:hypothetical protein [Agromyces sp. NPDC058064]